MAPGSKETSFHGCYLLCATCARSKGRTYIGYTVNPGRRIKQHNSGTQHGGAKRTTGREWDMVLIVYGFPTNTYALQFEWAWQHPRESLRLRQDTTIQKLSRKGRSLPHCWAVVCRLLRTGPWCRLPLHIRWLCPEYRLEFADDGRPPSHMGVSCGAMDIMTSNPIYAHISDECAQGAVDHLKQLDTVLCVICKQLLSSDSLWSQCSSHPCTATFHLMCLSRAWLRHGHDCHDNSANMMSSQCAVAVGASISMATVSSQPAASQRQALRQRLTRPKAAASSQHHQPQMSSQSQPNTAAAAATARTLLSSQRVPPSGQSLSATQRQQQQPPSASPSSSFPRHLLPIEGDCPTCHTHLQWGELVTWRKRLINLWDKPEKVATTRKQLNLPNLPKQARQQVASSETPAT